MTLIVSNFCGSFVLKEREQLKKMHFSLNEIQIDSYICMHVQYVGKVFKTQPEFPKQRIAVCVPHGDTCQ